MSYSVQPVVLPDFGATWQRGQQVNDQRESNALARMMQMRQFEQQQQFENVLAKPGIAQGLMSGDPSALASIGQFAGPQGFQMVLPLIRQQREEAMIRQALAGLGMGGAAPAAPGGMPAAPGGVPPVLSGPLPQAGPVVPAGPAAGDVRERNARLAAAREAVMNDPRLTPPQQQAALAQISAEAARASGLPTGPGYRAPEGVGGAFAGLPPPTGQVGGAPAAPAAPGRPGGTLPTQQQLMALLASGNPRLMEIAKALLPVVTRDPNLRIENIGGTAYQFDPRTGARTPIGPTDDVREETRTIDGQPVQGQVRNGVFTPYPERRDPADARNRDFGNTRQIRTEFADGSEVKDYRTVAPRVEAIRRAFPINSRASDLDMVYAFANLLDPGSVVKEGEQLMVRRTGGPVDSIMGMINGLNGGAQLTQDVRRDLLRQAESRFAVYADAYNQRLEYYRGLAQESGLNPDQIGRLVRPGVQAPVGSPQHPNGGPAEDVGRTAQITPQVRQSAAQALAAARAELGRGATDAAVLARAQEMMRR